MTTSCHVARLAFGISLVWLAVALLAPSRARADEAQAREHFRRGVELYDKKQYQAALASFEAAYREKPSPGIKQNIGLCHKGLKDPVAAATAFDEALDEGQGTLKPETRAAMELELGELSKLVATVQIRVVASADRRPLDDAIITVDGTPRTPAAWRRPIRLLPGIHVFTAHASGFADPPQKKLSILAGSPVDATFELGAPTGIILVRPNVADALIKIDGVDKARGQWEGEIAAGPHRIEVSAPEFQTTYADVVVTAGANVEYPIRLHRYGDLPPAYDGPPDRTPRAEKPVPRWSIVPMIVVGGVSYNLAPTLFESNGATPRGFGGGSAGVRGGYKVARLFAIELYGEIGALTSKYKLAPSDTRDTETSITQWHVMPMVRFVTSGKVRFTSGTGVGVHGVTVETIAPAAAVPGSTTTSRSTRVQKGKGTGASWMVDAGLQFDIGTLFLEGVAFFDLHGVGTVRADDPNAQQQRERFLLGSPAVRFGGRIGLGIPF